MNQVQLRDRTKRFATEVARFCRTFPEDWDSREIAKQLLRSGTSVAANYRACGRARSSKEFCAKLGVVVEEADESQLWLEIVREVYSQTDAKISATLLREASELTAIFTASHRTARENLRKRLHKTKKGAT